MNYFVMHPDSKFSKEHGETRQDGWRGIKDSDCEKETHNVDKDEAPAAPALLHFYSNVVELTDVPALHTLCYYV